ncbi:MAG: diguanylate cyclase [Bacillota bacterium]
MGRLARRLVRTLQVRTESGRLTVMPLMLLAAAPYLLTALLYLGSLDAGVHLAEPPVREILVKVVLALIGPVALGTVWMRVRPARRVRWAYDWIGGWMVTFAMGSFGAIGRDLIDLRQADLVGNLLFGWSGVAWFLSGTVLLVAGAVHFTLQIQEERSERQRLEALMRFTRHITSLEFQTTLDETVRELYRLLRADACVLLLWSDEEQMLVPAASQHSPEIYTQEYVDRMMAFKCPLGYGLTGSVMASGEPYICHDVYGDTRSMSVPGYETAEKSSLLAPLIVEGRKLGVVRLTRRGLHQFSQDDLDLAMSFVGQAALLIEHGRVLKELSEISITDSLTGLFNARHFHGVLEREVQLAVRHDRPLSLLMIDSDSLKLVNDRLGHQTGNDYLKRIGRAIKDTIRSTDVAFRYAGDEFLVLLPVTGAEMARDVAERIRLMVEASDLDYEVNCTVSIGVATLPAHAADPEGLLSAADEAMYRSKRAGKNRTSVSHRLPANVSG